MEIGRWANPAGASQRTFGHPGRRETCARDRRACPDFGVEFFDDLWPSRPRIWKRITRSRLRPHELFPATYKRKPGRLKGQGVRVRFIGETVVRLTPSLGQADEPWLEAEP